RAIARTTSSRSGFSGSIWKPPPPMATIVRGPGMAPLSPLVRLQTHRRRPVAVEHVDRVDEADLLGLVRHHQRVRPGAAAEVPDPLEQVAGGAPRGGEDEPLPGGELLGRVDAFLVTVAHRRAAGMLLVAAVAEARLDLAAEAAQGGGGQDALRRPAD